jgi:transposase-like protein
MADTSKRKRRRYTDGERAEILRDAEQLGVAATADKHGIPQSTVSNWRNRDSRRVPQPSAEPLNR